MESLERYGRFNAKRAATLILYRLCDRQQQQQQHQRFTRMKKVDDVSGSGSGGLLQSIGLWRGWRVGFWGLVGVWGAAACGGGGGGGGGGVEF